MNRRFFEQCAQHYDFTADKYFFFIVLTYLLSETWRVPSILTCLFMYVRLPQAVAGGPERHSLPLSRNYHE
jgi:hypothetical protein